MTNIADARRELKALGYRVRTARYSDFTAATVYHTKTNTKINGGNVFTVEFLEDHRAFFDWKRDKGDVFDADNVRVIF